MSQLRRHYSPGNTYFVTAVTYNRTAILIENIDLLLNAFTHVADKMPFRKIAYAILPDHFHLLIDPLDGDLSEIIKRIKLRFSGKYLNRHKIREGRLWQLRFWDHIIRDETDMNRHIDYIHFNPVKHKMVARPSEYEYSSFRDFVKNGFYSEEWGATEVPKLIGEYGE